MYRIRKGAHTDTHTDKILSKIGNDHFYDMTKKRKCLSILLQRGKQRRKRLNAHKHLIKHTNTDMSSSWRVQSFSQRTFCRCTSGLCASVTLSLKFSVQLWQSGAAMATFSFDGHGCRRYDTIYMCFCRHKKENDDLAFLNWSGHNTLKTLGHYFSGPWCGILEIFLSPPAFSPCPHTQQIPSTIFSTPSSSERVKIRKSFIQTLRNTRGGGGSPTALRKYHAKYQRNVT